MEDFKRDTARKHFLKLPPNEQREFVASLPPAVQKELLQALPLETRLAGVSKDQIREYLDRLTAGRPTASRKPRRKS